MVGLKLEISVPKPNAGLLSLFTKCALSPDGTRVVAGLEHTRGTISTTHLHVYDAATGGQQASLRCGRTESYAVKEGDGAVLALRFSVDGQSLLVSHEGEVAESAKTTCRGRAVLYDVVTSCIGDVLFQRLHVVGEHPEKILDVALSPDGRHAGTAGQDNRGGIWALNAKGIASQATWLEGHTSNVRSIDFSHDSSLVATASHDCTGRVYRVHGGACIAVLKGHDHWIYRVRFAPSAWQLATASADKKFIVWKVTEGRGAEGLDVVKMHCAQQTVAVRDLAWHRNGFFATSSGSPSVLIFDFANARRLEQVTFSGPKLSKASQDQGLSVSWANDVLMCSSKEAVQLWDLNKKARRSPTFWVFVFFLFGCFCAGLMHFR